MISARGLGKRYRIGDRISRYDTLAAQLLDVVRRPLVNLRELRRLDRFGPTEENDADTVWALRDLDLDVAEGEVLGVIGENGAGKSTLLKILSRITEPSTGFVDLRGRVGSLLEVGTGFHPELTGRENIYLNGTILGMSKEEIDSKYDAIVDFAGVARFLETPVKRYSSGMRVRLAFAVAAHLEPEILLVDEVLAVGDNEFQKKCLGKMDEVARSGRTVLFVSHNLGAVSELCDRSILLRDGRVVLDGPTEDAIALYLAGSGGERPRRVEFEPDPGSPITYRSLELRANGKAAAASIDIADDLTVVVRYEVNEPLRGTNLALRVLREGTPLFVSFDTDRSRDLAEMREKGGYEARISLPKRLLKAGRYTIELGAGRLGQQIFERRLQALSFEIEEVSEDVTHKSWAKKRRGALIMPLEWRQERTPE